MLMFQTHCYDSWMSPEAKRSSSLIAWSRLGGTLPAPLFIFLAGVSFALVTEKLREKRIERKTIAKQTILRGAEIFGMGLLFRVQEFALGYPWSPWTDLLRVDVLNILGLSMMLMGVLCWVTGDGIFAAARIRTLVAGLFAAVIVAMGTPPLWTTHRLKFLPWPIESYINGVHIFKEPQPWLFPLFPWSAFAFAGLAVGFFLFSDFAKRREGLAFARFRQAQGRAGVCTSGRYGNRCMLLVCFVRLVTRAAVRRLRLLAQQSGFSVDALRHFADDSVLGLRVVPVGTRAEGFQPDHPAWEYFVAGVLGAYRICLRKIFDPAKRAVQRAEGHGRADHDFSGDAGAVFGADKLEKVAGQGFTIESYGNCCDLGILMMTSPGLARPSSSRAIFSILRGSVFSSRTSCSSCKFSLFN